MNPTGEHPASDFFPPFLGWRPWRAGAEELLPGGRRDDGELLGDAVTSGGPVEPPDFFEPVVSWRVWRVVRLRGYHLLASLFVNIAWPSGVPLEAHCHYALGVTWPPHRAPHPTCDCGIYAAPLHTIDWELLCNYPRRHRPAAIGLVSLWGSVVEAERGWRAARAYPERIFVPGLGRRGRAGMHRLAEGLVHYGVPVEELEVDDPGEVVGRLAPLYPDAALPRPYVAALPDLDR